MITKEYCNIERNISIVISVFDVCDIMYEYDCVTSDNRLNRLKGI